MSPDAARAAIREGVAAAVRAGVGRRAAEATPVRVELRYSSPLYADIAEGIPGVRRVDARTVGFATDDYPAAYRMIRVLYKHLQP